MGIMEKDDNGRSPVVLRDYRSLSDNAGAGATELRLLVPSDLLNDDLLRVIDMRVKAELRAAKARGRRPSTPFERFPLGGRRRK